MELGLYNNLSILEPFITERRNTLVIGQQGTGKTSLLVRLALNDIHNNLPVTFIDNGKGVDEILKYIPKQRQPDVILFDPARFPFAFNILANVQKDKRELLASTILDTVKGVWGYENAPTPVLDQYFRGSLLTALSASDTSFLSLKFLLTNPSYRTQLLKYAHPILKDFWNDYETLTAKEQRQALSSTLNKLQAFLFSPHVRNVLDQKDNRLLFKDKIVLVALRTRELGTENACLLGVLVLASLYMADTPQNLYLDGARYGTSILSKLLSDCPSVATVVAVQFLDQLRKEFQPHLIGGVGQIVAFRTSSHDAEILQPDFHLDRNDPIGLNELKWFTAYACIDGKTTTLKMPQHTYLETHQERKIIDRCKSQCTAPIASIEKRLDRFLAQPRRKRSK